jgi:hypothetical protein
MHGPFAASRYEAFDESASSEEPSGSPGLSDRPAIDRAGAPIAPEKAPDEALIRLH